MDKHLQVDFWHGVGDSSHFAHIIALYQRHGYEFTVGCRSDRLTLFRSTGAEVTLEHLPGAVAWTEPPLIKDELFVHPARYNKPAYNLNVHPLPYLGKPEDLWDELVTTEVSLPAYIEAPDWEMVRRFIDPLPRPLILVHTEGFSCQNTKNVPPAAALGLYKELLDGCDGTLLILDWDGTAPRLSSPRVRHLLDDWCKLYIPQLAALLLLSDLIVGVDSGPFHLARMTRTPALGICLHHYHHPARFSLPRPGQAFVVPSFILPRTNRITRGAFNIIDQDTPKAADVARQALHLLQPPRYLRAHQCGADLLLQNWVRDRGKASPHADSILDRTLREITRRFTTPALVELGCFTSPKMGPEESLSTLVLGVLAHNGCGDLLSVQSDAVGFKSAMNSTRLLRNVKVAAGNSLAPLREEQAPIDVLFVSASGSNPLPGAPPLLVQVCQADLRLHRHSLVLLDWTWEECRPGAAPKPDIAQVSQWFLRRGWRVLAAGEQVLLDRIEGAGAASGSGQ